MILTGNAVREYIKNGGLKFDPPLAESQYQQNGVDLVVASVESTLVTAGGFTLGVTKEYITMPNNLIALPALRSTYARQGWTMLGPTIVDLGFEGDITLEIAKFGAPGYVPVGQPFVHLIFAETSGPGDPYRGKYQGQRGITHAR